MGYNHIDVAASRAAGIAVTNTPGAVTDATADIAMTLILMTARRAGEGERMLRAGDWTGWHPTQMLGLHLTGKTVCIVGMGRIGQAIAHRCHHGFGCRIVYVNRSAKAVDMPAEQMEMADALGCADVVVLATPGGADTHHLMGAEAFAAIAAPRDLRQHQPRRRGGRDRADRGAGGRCDRGRGGSTSTSSSRWCRRR